MPIEIADITLYSIAELADKFGITTLTWSTYIKDKKVQAQKVGGHWYIAEANLKEFLKVGPRKRPKTTPRVVTSKKI